MSSDITDENMEVIISRVLKQIEATKAVYELLLALKRGDDRPANMTAYGYSSEEKAELAVLHRRHLLRRVRDEMQKAGISFD